MPPIDEIDRPADLLLLVMSEWGTLRGITQAQVLTYFLASHPEFSDFNRWDSDFEWHQHGPESAELLDDLELLLQMGALSTTEAANRDPQGNLDFAQHEFFLTEKGAQIATGLRQANDAIPKILSNLSGNHNQKSPLGLMSTLEEHSEKFHPGRVSNIVAQYESTWANRLHDSARYVPEKYQLGLVLEFLTANEISYSTEHNLFNFPIDVIGLKEDNSWAVELKSKDIWRGYEQAQRDSDFVDYAWLAVWEEYLSEKLIEKISGDSIGLLSVNGGVEVVSEARKSDKQLYSRENVIASIKSNVRDDPQVLK